MQIDCVETIIVCMAADDLDVVVWRFWDVDATVVRVAESEPSMRRRRRSREDWAEKEKNPWRLGGVFTMKSV